MKGEVIRISRDIISNAGLAVHATTGKAANQRHRFAGRNALFYFWFTHRKKGLEFKRRPRVTRKTVCRDGIGAKARIFQCGCAARKKKFLEEVPDEGDAQF